MGERMFGYSRRVKGRLMKECKNDPPQTVGGTLVYFDLLIFANDTHGLV